MKHREDGCYPDPCGYEDRAPTRLLAVFNVMKITFGSSGFEEDRRPLVKSVDQGADRTRPSVLVADMFDGDPIRFPSVGRDTV